MVYVDGVWQPAVGDPNTNAIVTMSQEHREIHEGEHFFVADVITLTINQVLDFTWQMPNTDKHLHWKWKISTKAETEIYVYENAVVTNPLTGSIAPLNNNRNASETTGSTLKYEVQTNLAGANADTDVSAATQIHHSICGAGRDSGFDSRDDEIVLKKNAIYCLRATATAAGYINFHMGWYEHTPEDI